MGVHRRGRRGRVVLNVQDDIHVLQGENIEGYIKIISTNKNYTNQLAVSVSHDEEEEGGEGKTTLKTS